MTLKDFLNEFGGSLRRKIKMAPVFDPAHLDEWDKQAMAKLKKLARQPFPPQAKAILALAKGFYRENKKAEIMVGEMGTGKTICAIATAFLNPKKNHRTIVMCPGHLVDKWMREIGETVPQGTIVNLNNPGLKELFALKGQKPQGMEFYVVGKEQAKLHFAFKPAINKRGNKVYCPQCGKRLEKMESKIPQTQRRLKCPECGSSLWQADRNNVRRYAKAEFIKRYIGKGAFDLFVADEVHECKSEDSAQGQAFGCLAALSKRTLGLTGTLMGGYSKDLFFLLWRLFPSIMKDVVPYGETRQFASNYGVLQIVRKTPLKDNSHSLGGKKNREAVKEKPGVSPLVLTDFLLDNTVFMRLQDVSNKLPPYTEEVIGVEIIGVDSEKKRISLSMKQLEKDPWEVVEEKYPVGTKIAGRIKTVTNFGIFIGLGEGVDGLVHVSDMSWTKKVRNPEDIYKKGQEIEAVVLKIDRENERFSLGIKQLLTNPWDTIEERFPVGSTVQGTVTNLTDFGAFVDIGEDLEGLIHISELSDTKVNKVSDVLSAGDHVEVMVINLNKLEKKIGLSLRAKQAQENKKEYSAVTGTKEPSSSNFGTLLQEKLDEKAAASDVSAAE